MKPSDFLTELSNEKLAQYKTAASADASKADSEGDFKRGNKRFSGIVKATNKQFDNDAKKPKNESYTVEDEQIDGMAQGEIREIIKNAVHIKNQLDNGVSLDGWMYSFVTVSNDKLNSVAEQINNPNIEEQGVAEEQHSCPHCGGVMVSEELMNEKKDACYYKVKSRYSVWPSAYASGALVKCRKKGASNWGNGGKKNESSILEGIESVDESLHDWFNKEKWVRMDTKGNIKGPCAREPGEGKPKCLPQSKAHTLGKKGRASAAARKRREDPNPERHGPAINVNTKKK